MNGAVCCHRERRDAPASEWIVAASDVPDDRPFLEGAVVFQFACFGAGTPARSDFAHWLGDARANARADFVGAWPKRLLAHPRGPVAYIGHVDAAWVQGFITLPPPLLEDRWHIRLLPFRAALESLLDTQPVGLALAAMYKRYDVYNSQLANALDNIQSGRRKVSPELDIWLADTFITRSDAQNYIVLGDPAARLRLPVRSG
jgi:hypothetical protein